jgi:hypothetical protein
MKRGKRGKENLEKEIESRELRIRRSGVNLY